MSYIHVRAAQPEVPAILPGPTQHSRGFPRNREATSSKLSGVLVPVLPLRFLVRTLVSFRKTGQHAAPLTPAFVLLFLLSQPETAFTPQLELGPGQRGRNESG